MSARRRNTGFSLLEALCYIACLGVVINVGATTFVNAMRLNAHSYAQLDNLRGFEELHSDLVETVSQSSGIQDVLPDIETGEQCVLLRLSHRKDPVSPVFIGFRYDPETKRVSRFGVIQRDEAFAEYDLATYPIEMESAVFSYDPAQSLVSLDFQMKSGFSYRFVAAPSRMANGEAQS